MFLKPKSTHLEPKALLYRLYIDIVFTNTLQYCYLTVDGKYWQYDNEKLEFYQVEGTTNFKTIKSVTNETVLRYLDKCYKYDNGWVETENTQSLAVKFSNIGKYQTNNYYYSGSFSYIKKGTINDTVIQPIRGNITPLKTLTIQYYNDSINLKNGDLVVIDNHLYSVESVDEDHKHQPKDFAIYTALLNSIL